MNEFFQDLATGAPMTGTLVPQAQKKKRGIMLGDMLRRPVQSVDPALAQSRAQRNRAIAETLTSDMTRPTVSGSILEGLARGGEAFFKARSARDAISLEDQKKAEQKAKEAAKNKAIADAITAGMDGTPEKRRAAMVGVLGGNADTAPMALEQQFSGANAEIDQAGRIATSKATANNQAMADLLAKGYTLNADGSITMAAGGPAAVQESQFDRELGVRAANNQAENDYRQAMLSRTPAPETKGQARQGKRLSDEADAAQAARTQALKVMSNAQRWLGLSEKFETGMGRDLFVGMSAAGQEMDAITKELVTQLPRLPGAASERDAINLERSTLQITKSPAANKNIALAQIAAAQNAVDYSDFVEATIEAGGTLRDAQSLSSAYLQEVPIFGEGGVVNPTRPRFGVWLQAKQKEAEIERLKAGGK